MSTKKRPRVMPRNSRKPMPPTVRDIFKATIAKHGLSQAAFARKVKTSNGYICDVMSLRRNISPAIIERFGKAFGVPNTELKRLSHTAAAMAGWNLPALQMAPRKKTPVQSPKRPAQAPKSQKRPNSQPPGKSKAPVPVPQQTRNHLPIALGV